MSHSVFTLFFPSFSVPRCGGISSCTSHQTSNRNNYESSYGMTAANRGGQLMCAGLLEMRALLDREEVLDALLSHLDVCPKTDCFAWQGLADEIEHLQTSALNAQVWPRLIPLHALFCASKSRCTTPTVQIWQRLMPALAMSAALLSSQARGRPLVATAACVRLPRPSWACSHIHGLLGQQDLTSLSIWQCTSQTLLLASFLLSFAEPQVLHIPRHKALMLTGWLLAYLCRQMPRRWTCGRRCSTTNPSASRMQSRPLSHAFWSSDTQHLAQQPAQPWTMLAG